MAQELKTLIAKRGQIKAAVTRFQKYVDNAKESAIDIYQLKQRMTNFRTLMQRFEEIQEDIELINSEDEANEIEREAFENVYYQLLSDAEKLIPAKKEIAATEATPTIPVDSHIRLPRINLPIFDGSFDNWYAFYDTFLSMIHLKHEIPDIQKFHYLKSSLTGEAASFLQSLEFSADNYVNAWELLKERYNNKRIIVQSHIKAIFNIPGITKESSSGIRNIVDSISKHVNSLKTLGRPTSSWDDLIIYLLTSKLDFATNKEWESTLRVAEMPTLEELKEFLTRKCQTLEVISNSNEKCVTDVSMKGRSKKLHVYPVTKSYPVCVLCKGDHNLKSCQKFLKIDASERIAIVKTNKLCTNCLRPNHTVYQCYKGKCNKCSRKHNILLHDGYAQPQYDNNGHKESTSSSQPAEISAATSKGHNLHSYVTTQVLLPTALVNIKDNKGCTHTCRALLDTGSQSNFITVDLANRLGLRQTNVNIPIQGVSQGQTYVKRAVNVTVESRFNAFRSNVKCLLLSIITAKLPGITVGKELFNIPKNIKLADPTFNECAEIDLLLGADIFWQLLCIGQIKSNGTHPWLQKTHLGWIVSGPSLTYNHSPKVCNLSIEASELDAKIAKFWEVEEVDIKNLATPEQMACEEHFRLTHYRNSNGQFVVKLPFKKHPSSLGDSKTMALKRFYNLERKLDKHPQMKSEYADFLHEYESLGHMQAIHESYCPEITEENTFYLPHHCVIKPSSTTTKLRVVFDGSAKSSNGLSLNDILMVGPTLQEDLFSILLRFRIHKFVITADVEKMYRQILIDESQSSLQRIFWRENKSEPVKIYELKTVTYGTSSASFLSTRCLHQLACEEEENSATRAIKRDFYVDDLLTGADNKEELSVTRDKIIDILSKGGFRLRKWFSNSQDLIPISEDSRDIVQMIPADQSAKTLGVEWHCVNDTLGYTVSVDIPQTRITKRALLSAIAQLFDPLGLINPVVVIAKLLMQRLWQLKLSWDESLPLEVYTAWKQYVTQLLQISDLKIPRMISREIPLFDIEIHGFADASQSAYGACVYIRSPKGDGDYTVSLLCAKSKVAPLKTISIPRLELCAALLLARLLEKVISSLQIDNPKVYCWTDSTIVLSWIKAPSYNWKTFVANRVNAIQELTEPDCWKHVRTTDNPADIISRGCYPEELVKSKLWFEGPHYLKLDPVYWPEQPTFEKLCDLPEHRNITLLHTVTEDKDSEIFNRYSNFSTLVRITAWCVRFARLCRKQTLSKGQLTVDELEEAELRLVKVVQASEFKKELQTLSKNHSVPPRSRLASLNTFVDNNGIIRVGGRLQNSELSFNRKHPIILPPDHVFSKLIIAYEHARLLHAGLQTTIASLRCRYWILSTRSTVRKIIYKCPTCFRLKPRTAQPIMGNLPKARTIPSRPFSTTGVDYFGPFMIRQGGLRSKKLVKAYAAIFVCFATRAVHIELVSDLTTAAFIAALRRFIGRRGKPSDIYSDNGTNFVGARNELKEFRKFMSNHEELNGALRAVVDEKINWHFIPPRAPNFGGLWEAAVKSAKHHILRVAGNAHFTFEELQTVLVQVEAVLNSRPISPISTDPNDLTTLTPGHFLIGDALTSFPEPDLQDVPINRLSRWQHIQRIRDHFWKRWSLEYIGNLQQRTKWRSGTSTKLSPGQLVLIKEDNASPLQWSKGRVVQVHPGTDGIVRTASVRTASGVVKRATNKLCVLPMSE